ncbi:endonuclease domain-containing 1 protein-like isoform X2 [Archocentrus centrarchus]|uniref:endonuclease domain-containing 1 protein-like isoform X2 n=1 Tax=Archocentrus centrarchus TaxID=63155 RepID=UPI0011E9DF01|nr:endonuclease domain-containing 1 protein-like isoform X2 [Archocentrus centrarchus]
MQSSVSVYLLLFISSVSAEVVANFELCKKYFYKDHVPQWPAANTHIHICQVNANSYRFATLYDTINRIPIYSAYTVEENGKISRPRWMVEPQLVDQNYEKEMMTEDSLKYKHKVEPNVMGKRQALDEDYKKAPEKYDRGHLNPDSHHADDAAKATYTLTNIVPQKDKLNRGKWKEHEDKLRKLSNNNQVFVLVGAIPSSDNWIKINNEPRVNIPDYMWVAYCYFDRESNSFKSGGATAKNTENKLYECSLRDLQEFLQEHIQQLL